MRNAFRYSDLAFLALACLILAGLILATDPANVPDAPKACWVEDKAGTSYPPERVCGYVRSAPNGSRNFSDTIPQEDEPAFDCQADGNGICGRIDHD